MADEWWGGDPAASPLDVALSLEDASPDVAAVARSVYHQESGSGKNTKTSNAGAVGGMQVIPSTFHSVADQGWDINDPVHNARAGVRYLNQLNQKAGGDPKLTAVGYYGGPGAIDKARKGLAVSDPRNPNAPNTLQYGDQVASRIPNGSSQGDNSWYANDPVASQDDNSWFQNDPEADQGDQGAPAAPQDSHPLTTAIGNAVMHPLDTASAIGDKAVQFGQDLGNQIADDPLAAAKGAAIGVGNGLTFGGLKKGTAYLNSLDGTGKSYEDSLKEQDDYYKSLGPAETAGELGAAFVPGVGELALLNKGVGAVKTASRLAKVATGAGIGGAEGLANYVGHNEGTFSPVDAATSTVLGAAGGAIPGALDAHTVEQRAGSFLKSAGNDASKAARDAEITTDLKALADREAQSGTALGPKQANQVAAGYTQDAMKAVREMPAGAEKDALVEALDKGAGWSDARVNALRTSDAGNAVADAIQKRVRTDALTAAVPAKAGLIRTGLRMAADNIIPIAPVRHFVTGALGSRTYRPQTIANLLKNSDNAAAFLQVNGGSAASKSAQSLADMAAQAQNFQGPLQQAARAAGSGGRAAPTAEELAAKAQAARALDIAKRTAGYRKDNQTQWAQNRAASTAEQVAQEQQANAQAADEAARQASIAKRTEFARQQNLAGFQGNTQAERAAQAAAEQQAQAADLARKAQSRAAVGNLVNQNADNAAQAGAARQAATQADQSATAQAVQRAQAATADRAARSEAARQARVSGEAAEAKATAASVKAEARAKVKADKEAAAKAQAEQYQVAGQRVANGDFTGLDIEHPRMQHMLKFVNSDDPAVIKQAVSQVAQADPEHAAVAAQTMTHGAPQANYYQLQKALQDKLGKRTPVAPTPEAPTQPAALTLEEQMRLAKYNGGIKNNQSLVETVKAQAEDGDVKTMLAKMGTKSTPEDRKAILDKFLSQHSDATKVISAKRLGEQLIEGVTK